MTDLKLIRVKKIYKCKHRWKELYQYNVNVTGAYIKRMICERCGKGYDSNCLAAGGSIGIIPQLGIIKDVIDYKTNQKIAININAIQNINSIIKEIKQQNKASPRFLLGLIREKNCLIKNINELKNK